MRFSNPNTVELNPTPSRMQQQDYSQYASGNRKINAEERGRAIRIEVGHQKASVVQQCFTIRISKQHLTKAAKITDPPRQSPLCRSGIGPSTSGPILRSGGFISQFQSLFHLKTLECVSLVQKLSAYQFKFD